MPLWISILSVFNFVTGIFHLPVPQSTAPVTHGLLDRKVPVILAVMSKCPDAVACEAVFDDVLTEVGDMMDLQLTFIAT